MAVKLEAIKDDIIALQPVYVNTGNATQILLREGDRLDSRGMRSVLAALARVYAIDLTAQRKNLEMRLDRHGIMPFYLGRDRVFIPLKMRQAAVSKDMVYGYVDVRFIRDGTPSGPRSCRVPLHGGREIEVMSSRSTVLQCQHMGQRLLEMLMNGNTADAGEKVLADAGLYLHRTIKGLEQRLEHIEAVISEQAGREEKE